MVYKVIGLMSGSSLDGLDIAYVHLQEKAGKWEYQFIHTELTPYPPRWRERLASAPQLSALDYQLLHVEYGHWLGEEVNRFIVAHGLDYQVQLIASHGHTVFHLPAWKMTAQLGDGAALAAGTGINVVSDLRAMDLALGGQGAPIVPGGERLLFADYEILLNLGGIANISGGPIAFDICPCNRVLNMLAEKEGKAFDADGALAAAGRMDEALLRRLNALPYYSQGYPKSLANDFGTDTVYPMLNAVPAPAPSGTADALRTYVEHIAVQVRNAVNQLRSSETARASDSTERSGPAPSGQRLLVTGGGAHNGFLVGRLRELLQPLEIVVPETALIDYKEALVIALLGVLRWREENNVLASVTGARRDSIGGAVWMGQEI